ncbi:MAG: vanadium-dependent haloperoxidase [Planctomycetota bacterium]
MTNLNPIPGTKAPANAENTTDISSNRRGFLKTIVASAASISVAGAAVHFTAPQAEASEATDKKGALKGKKRRARALALRNKNCRESILKQPVLGDNLTNGDEQNLPNFINQFTKGLPHEANGEVTASAYVAMRAAIESGDFAQIESLTLGHSNPAEQRKLRNPLAGLAFDTEGVDAAQAPTPAPPQFSSPWQAGEMVELYWMALLRDVHFQDYATNQAAIDAATEISQMSDFRGPKMNTIVTAQTLFRDTFQGCKTGPYVSQFLLHSVPYGQHTIDARMHTFVPGVHYGTTFNSWKDIQNGRVPQAAVTIDPQDRYIRNGRDIAAWVRNDAAYQAFLNAALILMLPPNANVFNEGGGMGAPLKATNPYNAALKQDTFVTLGPVNILSMLAEVVYRCMKPAWHQKWYVHFRARPEEFGGRVRQHVHGNVTYPIHPDVLNSQALQDVFAATGDYFLPLVFPEGSPLHPSYPSGHATFSGACITILKALFDETFVIPAPKVASADGLSLVDYLGSDAGEMTVGGELNKLASNIATARNIAGLHWRSDGNEGIRLGEQVAISVLREHRDTYAEDFPGFTFTGVDGNTIVI